VSPEPVAIQFFVLGFGIENHMCALNPKASVKTLLSRKRGPIAKKKTMSNMTFSLTPRPTPKKRHIEK
jgi:hypothetical protein